MADELDVLLDKVGDASLRAQLRGEIDKVRAKRTFGLVFESHLPERVRLPEHPVRRGTKVVRRADKHGDTMKVTAVRRNQATVELPEGGSESIPLDDLVVVAEFGEPVYPGLTRLGSIDRGGDKPAHLVINTENHHALEMLQFTHAGTVDCIYIDPPYNTGAKDWKYDNNYVDGEDPYRHSKYVRIESIVKVGDTLRVLDLHDPGVRAAVMEFDGAQVAALYEGDLAREYR